MLVEDVDHEFKLDVGLNMNKFYVKYFVKLCFAIEKYKFSSRNQK